MKGRKIYINNEFKKKLTVSPFMPGAPTEVYYPMYKITNKFMYIPRYYNNDGELILNELIDAASTLLSSESKAF